VQDANNSKYGDLGHCKCGLCDHDSRFDCISGRCYCCDLEDAFSILTHHEFESPQSKFVTRERLNDSIAA
jgi:hypothetical protein